ncbi:polysaccharide deacetylase family protein [Candidatus Pelagibacter bacterium]|nr:polysaccharide deacetylase family protein [Candidatus Pelagibacter bacterium]
MKFKIRKFLIINIVITIFIFQNNLFSKNLVSSIEDFGIISLMYHRFEENKYPSTNIRLKDFEEHIRIIEENRISFVNPKNFEEELKNNKSKRKILLTIDDGFSSFYENAWPILKEKKIPFILFVSTREVGAFNYMTWDQIRELSKEDFVEIGNHSHSHEYLADVSNKLIKEDISKSISIFNKNLGKNSNFFSYPFGEYSNDFKNIIKDFGFKYAFGQHSGVMDETKDFYELPRYPINEKYGEVKRFKSLTKTLPFKFKEIFPDEKYLTQIKNPPNVKIEFYKDIKNLKSVNCYSNEGGKWRQSNINFENSNTLSIIIDEKFVGERGRINCSLRDPSGLWRWLGIQFVIGEK